MTSAILGPLNAVKNEVHSVKSVIKKCFMCIYITNTKFIFSPDVIGIEELTVLTAICGKSSRIFLRCVEKQLVEVFVLVHYHAANFGVSLTERNWYGF